MKNYYIERNNGNIINLFARSQYDEQEFLSEDDQEIIDHFAVKQAIEDVEQNRRDEIEAEKINSGLNNITVTQAHDRIDQIFSGATTVALLRAACIRAFKILVIFILR